MKGLVATVALAVAVKAFLIGVTLVGRSISAETPPKSTTVEPEHQETVQTRRYKEYVPPEGRISGTSHTTSTLGSATKPTSGKWVYLTTIRRYISLPDDVEHVGTAMGTCKPKSPVDDDYLCPDFPLQDYRRGTAFVSIDQSGNLWGTDQSKARFPFFQFLSSTEEGDASH